MSFSLDSNPSTSEIADAINYLLANLNAGVPAQSTAVSNNTSTGFITNAVNDLLSYQYRYIDIKYADSISGDNFSDNPSGKLYFGIRNDDFYFDMAFSYSTGVEKYFLYDQSVVQVSAASIKNTNVGVMATFGFKF